MAQQPLLDNPENKERNAAQRGYDTLVNPEKNGTFSGDRTAADTGLKEQEEDPIDTAENWSTNVTGKSQQKISLKGKWSTKQKSWLVGIIVMLLGGGGILGTLFAPGIGIVQMKEVLTADLNDQLAAMDIRADHVFRAKLKGMTSGVCAGGFSIKCKFSTMSQRQVEKFRKAGFDIPEDSVEKTKLGRYRILNMTTPDGVKINNPNDLVKARQTSPSTRSAMKRVFNPVYYGVSDKVANTFFQKNKVSKQKVITDTSEEENRKALKEATAGERATGGRGVVMTEGDKEYVIAEDGSKVYEGADNYEDEKQKAEQRGSVFAEGIDKQAASPVKATAGFLNAAVKGVGILGAVDTACTIYNTARAVSAAAKIARSMQLIQFAMAVNTAADSIKAGDATPNETNFVGTMYNTTDTRKQIVSEQSGEEGELIDNPFYGKSAFDSPGYKVAAYNDAPVLTSQSQQYMVGGGLSGTLSDTLVTVKNAIGGDPKTTCGFVQSPWVRGAGLIVGIVAAVGSAGVITGLSVAASVAFNFAAPFLEAMLADIVGGKVIADDISGVDAGDAAFSGTAAMLGGIAQNRGMAPMSAEGFKTYTASTAKTNSDMIAAERYEAAKTPFDISNQYSFIGSFVRTLNPSVVSMKSSASGAVSGVASIITKGFASLFKPVSAAESFNNDRLKRCNDEGYKEIGIDGDVFCNVRYGLTPTELAMDSDVVLDFMIDNDMITDNGDPKTGSEYETFVQNCVQREDGWGESSTENGSRGDECIDGNPDVMKNISYFRVYTMDKSLSEAMDDEIQTPGTTTATGKPDGAIDSDRGWTLARDTDYSKYECDPRTEDVGVFKSSVNGITVRLCKISFNTPDLPNGGDSVASVISKNTMDMFEAARDAGVELGISDGMRRTFLGAYTSMHTFGVALDLGAPRSGQTICYGGDSQTGYGSKGAAEAACKRRGGLHYEAYQWLQKNAAQYGFYNYEVEPWHWSSSGR